MTELLHLLAGKLCVNNMHLTQCSCIYWFGNIPSVDQKAVT